MRAAHRFAAWIIASATGDSTARLTAMIFVLAHAALWTLILTVLKASQDVHFDTSEAYAWGQQFLLGYGKHPPLSGWIAGIWFRLVPPADWSAYGLAMATCGVALFVSWEIAQRVVDRRRAFFALVLLSLYPILNFKGYKYNADLAQLATLPLIVLAYLHAFEKRTAMSGVWLGLAAAAGMLTKYWAATMIGGVGLAALLHPERMAYLRSSAPWVAIAVFLLAMSPHLWWLYRVDFAPFAYAGAFYASPSQIASSATILGFLTHNLALLSPVVLLGLLALAIRVPGGRKFLPGLLPLKGGPNKGVNLSQALNVWIIQVAVVVAPLLAGLAYSIHVKTDWGIPLFFLVPLALIAIPAVRVPKAAVFNVLLIWLIASAGSLALAPRLASESFARAKQSVGAFVPSSGLARQLTRMWHMRFPGKWPVVASFTEASSQMAFYSPDHPAPLELGDAWTAGLATLDKAKASGFIGVCDELDPRLAECRAWMAEHAAGAEHLTISERRFHKGVMGPKGTWQVYIVPPAR